MNTEPILTDPTAPKPSPWLQFYQALAALPRTGRAKHSRGHRVAAHADGEAKAARKRERQGRRRGRLCASGKKHRG